jgi:hypothetical protein
MTITVPQFRVWYPEFGSPGTYPDSQVNYWICAAQMLIGTDRLTTDPGPCGYSLWDLGCSLFVAHNLVLEKQAYDAAKNGGTPGTTVGPASSKTVGPVSVGYDTSMTKIDGAGPWNATIYGQRFYQLYFMVGAGVIFVGAGSIPAGWFGPAWFGPWPYPSMTGFTN